MRTRHYLSCLFLAAAACCRAADPDQTIKLPTNAVGTSYDITVEPDMAAQTYRASASIQVTVKEATGTIVVNSADIVVDKVSLQGVGTPSVSYDNDVQTVTFTFAQKLAPGPYTLDLQYHGKIYQEPSGFFALDYDSPTGRKRALFTQFENSDARRFVPCWDEPAQKATFTLNVTAPSDMMAVSNMPVASSEPAGNGLKRVRFAKSPRMSPYLLFLAVGDFERIHRDVGGTDVGVIVKRGYTAQGQYALETACDVLGYYNDYFGTPYPLPKLDLVAGPGESQFFSAMENWGAIYYFESSILFDPKITSEENKRWIYETIAHEMSHQWFGDLVTMRWWDNLWLNEGFASWMQEKATNHFHPEWRVWLDTLGYKQNAMLVDARNGTHPVIVPIHDVLQAGGSFDTITYSKGMAVIRMLEAYVGEEPFRRGIRQYIKDYAYGNTDTEQLWAELDAVSDRKLTAVAHDFTLKAGVPMLTVQAAGKGISLTQKRYALDSSGDAGGAWTIPALIQPRDKAEPSSLLGVTSLPGQATVVADAPPGSVVNAGQTAYLRVRYEGEAFTAMSARFSSFSPDDQIGILNDAFSIGGSGQEPLSDALKLAERLPADAYPSVWSALANRLRYLDQAHDGLPTQGAYRHFVSGVATPALQRLGYEPKEGESANVTIMRSDLITLLGRIADPATVAWSREKFAAFLKDPDSINGTERESVLKLVAQNADQGIWDQLHALERTAPSLLEKTQYVTYLSSTADPALAEKALGLSLTDELDPTFRPTFVNTVGRLHNRMALDFAIKHWDTLQGYLEMVTRPRFIPRLAGGSFDVDTIAIVEAFAKDHIPETARQTVRMAEGQIRAAALLRNSQLPEVDRWLAARQPISR